MLFILIGIALVAGHFVGPHAGLGVLLVGIFNCLDDIRAALNRAYPSPANAQLAAYEARRAKERAEEEAAKVAAVEKERAEIAAKKAARETQRAAANNPRLRCPRCASPMNIEETRCQTCQHIRPQSARTP